MNIKNIKFELVRAYLLQRLWLSPTKWWTNSQEALVPGKCRTDRGKQSINFGENLIKSPWRAAKRTPSPSVRARASEGRRKKRETRLTRGDKFRWRSHYASFPIGIRRLWTPLASVKRIMNANNFPSHCPSVVILPSKSLSLFFSLSSNFNALRAV